MTGRWRSVRVQGGGGVGVGLVAAALAALGVPRWVWIVVLVVGVGLMLAAIAQLAVRTRIEAKKAKLPKGPGLSRREAAQPFLRLFADGRATTPDGVEYRTQAGPYHPRTPVGDLPLHLDMEGIQGSQIFDSPGRAWVWTARDVGLVNDSDEFIRCRVRLIAGISSDNSRALDLVQSPNEIVSVDPRGATQVTLEFALDPISASGQSGDPLELVLLEIGSVNRELRVPLVPAAGSPRRPKGS